LPNPLITWAISFILPRVLDGNHGIHTSVVRTQMAALPIRPIVVKGILVLPD
jgi:hypothetical protein